MREEKEPPVNKGGWQETCGPLSFIPLGTQLASNMSQLSVCSTCCLPIQSFISQHEWASHVNVVPWPSVHILVFITLSCNYKTCLSSSLTDLSFPGEGTVSDTFNVAPIENSPAYISKLGDLDCFIYFVLSAWLIEMLNNISWIGMNFCCWKFTLSVKVLVLDSRKKIILSRTLQQMTELQGLFPYYIQFISLSLSLKSNFFYVLKYKLSVIG